MKSLLIIFSYNYPYNPPVESFLDKEIPFLNNGNYKIVVIPTGRVLDQYPLYELDNKQSVSYIKLARKNKRKELFCGLKFIIKDCLPFSRDFFHILFKTKHNKVLILKKTAAQYMESEIYYNEFIKQFKSFSFNEYDSVVLYSYWLGACSLFTAKLKKYLLKKGCINVKAISRAHGLGDLYFDNNDLLFRPGLKILLNNIDYIYPISNNGKQLLERQSFKNIKTEKLCVPEGLSKNELNHFKKNMIVSCSVINDNKRVIDIAKAIACLKREVEWIHFGYGEQFDALKKWCESNMPTNVKWTLHGKTSNNSVIDFYKRNKPTLFINLSKVEGIPVSIMEAFSCGIPAVATDVGATSEIVFNMKNGITINSEYEISDVVEAIEKIMDCKEELNMNKEAYNTWKEQYSEKNYLSFADELSRLKQL